MPNQDSRRTNRIPWSIVSKAADRSNSTRKAAQPSSAAISRSLWTLSNAVSLLWFVLYADWCGSSRQFAVGILRVSQIPPSPAPWTGTWGWRLAGNSGKPVYSARASWSATWPAPSSCCRDATEGKRRCHVDHKGDHRQQIKHVIHHDLCRPGIHSWQVFFTLLLMIFSNDPTIIRHCKQLTSTNIYRPRRLS